MKSNQNLRVFWKPVNPQECEWKNHYPIAMRTILPEEETIHCSISIGTQIYSYAPSQENSCSTGSIGQGMGKIGKDSGVEPDESQ